MHKSSFPTDIFSRNLIVSLILLGCLFTVLFLGACSPSRTVSEAFSSQEREFWFEIDGPIGKDTLIEAVYVVQDGVVSVYGTRGGLTNTLGDIPNYNDGGETVADDIIKANRESDKTDIRENFARNHFEKTTPKFILNTDQTGRTVMSETIVLNDKSSNKCNIITVTGEASELIKSSVWSGFSIEHSNDRDNLTSGTYLLQFNPKATTVMDPLRVDAFGDYIGNDRIEVR